MIGCDRSSDDSAYGRIALIRLYISRAQTQHTGAGLELKRHRTARAVYYRCGNGKCLSCLRVLLYYLVVERSRRIEICRLIGGEHEIFPALKRESVGRLHVAVVRAVGKVYEYRAVVVGRVDFVVGAVVRAPRLTVKSHLQVAHHRRVVGFLLAA